MHLRQTLLWLTDITQFAASDAKVYLSPMIDCCDGKIVAWLTSRHPDNALVESMLNKALDALSETTKQEIVDKANKRKLIIHADRGGHYRGEMWIDKLQSFSITRSMSRKGNSGDNAACEGFFGRMKTEMYYGIKWESADKLEQAINDYIRFYNGSRIKMSLGGLSINEYRARCGVV